MSNESVPKLPVRTETAVTVSRHTEVQSHLDSQLAPLDAIPCHPLGVKPSGNGLIAEWNLRTAAGKLATLPDDLILLLLEHLDSSSLRRFGATCKALYAFTRSEDLWKRLFIL
jgi:hypothetical protein